MSTIALNNQNVYVNNKAEKKVEKKMSVWAKIGAFIMENADALEAYASVIFKPMDFQQLIERVICGGEILVNMGKANFVNIFQISAPHMLFEKAAEIFGLQRGNI